MSTIIALDKRSVKLEDISVYVECPACGTSYNIQLRSPEFSKNCRCTKGTFFITVTSLRGSRISVQVLHQSGFQQPVEVHPMSWSIE